MRNIFFIFLLFPLYLAAQTITGKVTCQGKGVNNVIITDGIRCTTTNNQGYYQLKIEQRSKFVYLSTPSGYLIDQVKGNPIFYQLLKKEKTNYHFELHKNTKNDNHHLCFVHADPQLYALKNLAPYREILNDCKQLIQKNKNQDIIGIDCGDLVSDRPALFKHYIASTAKLNIPFYKVIGNHDMTLYGRSHETSYQKFEALFGPTYYSFNKGKAHYIILNDVFYLARQYFYIGYLEEKILAWLEQDLAYVPKDHLVFVAMHIPSQLEKEQTHFQYNAKDMASQMCNAKALHQILAPYNAHILAGHMHYNKNIIHSKQLYEHITGAVCGTWWQGKVCLDGTPQGYGVYEIRGNKVTWYFKSAGHTKDYQMKVYPIGSCKEYPNAILVNVWNWDKDWTVELIEENQTPQTMKRISTYDPEATKLCQDKEHLDFKWISPKPNKHMFIATPRYSKTSIKIRVTDRFGRIYETLIPNNH